MIFKNQKSCPLCEGRLKQYDKVKRIVRIEDSKAKHVKIRRMKCVECGHVHRELPSYMLPYKQYTKDIISGVLQGFITCETLGYEDYPCEMTMARWLTQKSELI